MRERARIDEIVSSHVTLKRRASARSRACAPSTTSAPVLPRPPQVGRWHCFGCNEGGDVISFIQKIDGMTFTEAVEYLADRVGIQLRYEEGGVRAAPRSREASATAGGAPGGLAVLLRAALRARGHGRAHVLGRAQLRPV
ncbi:CHC2 zinc finger domain-containing protein [Oerskovia sp. M15]